MPTVSIVIPAYKAEAFIEEAVASALAQTAPVERVVVVDDGSPDRTGAIAQRLQAAHPGVLAITRPNGGVSTARNTGLAAVSSDFVLFLDADDRLHPEAVERHLAAFDRVPDAVMVFGSNRVIASDGRLLGENLQTAGTATFADIVMRVIPVPSQCLYRRPAVTAAGGYDPDFTVNEDAELNLRLARLGAIHCHGEMVMDYRRHSGQATRNIAQLRRYQLRALRKNLGPDSPDPDPALLVRASMRFRMACGARQHRVALAALARGRVGEARIAAGLALDALLARIRSFGLRPLP